MTLPIQFGATAAVELADAARWYEERRPGLGHRFVAAVEVTIDSLALWPLAGTPVGDPDESHHVRRAPVERFPYHVGYLVAEEQIVILAIAHDRRRPHYWSGRT